MKLYLMRHGDAISETINPERPLSEKGNSEINKLGKFIKPLHLNLARIFHSDKLRAKQTAEIIAHNVGFSKPLQNHPSLQPSDDIMIIANELDKLNGDTLLVGHLPYLSDLVSYLVSGQQHQPLVNFVTGTLVCLEKTQNFWIIDWLVSPELLKV